MSTYYIGEPNTIRLRDLINSPSCVLSLSTQLEAAAAIESFMAVERKIKKEMDLASRSVFSSKKGGLPCITQRAN